jgi:hypothetical protein
MGPMFTAKLRCPVIDILLHNLYTTFLTGLLDILVDPPKFFADYFATVNNRTVAFTVSMENTLHC